MKALQPKGLMRWTGGEDLVQSLYGEKLEHEGVDRRFEKKL
jgi:hypothetical protein